MFGPPKSLLRRCLGVQTPTHKVFGRLGLKNLASTPISARGNTFVLLVLDVRRCPTPQTPKSVGFCLVFFFVSAQDLLVLHPDFLLISLRCLCNFYASVSSMSLLSTIRSALSTQRIRWGIDQTWGGLLGNVLKVCQLWEAKALELLDVCIYLNK